MSFTILWKPVSRCDNQILNSLLKSDLSWLKWLFLVSFFFDFVSLLEDHGDKGDSDNSNIQQLKTIIQTEQTDILGLLTNNVSPQIPHPYQINGFKIVVVTICGSSNKQKQMNVSPILVRTVGHAWMGFTVSRACVQVRTLAHFAKVRKLACHVLLYFLF